MDVDGGVKRESVDAMCGVETDALMGSSQSVVKKEMC